MKLIVMGIVILPFLLGALALSISSIRDVFQLLRDKKVGLKELIYGLLVSASIFGIISVSYLIEGKAWVLSPTFRIPICMVFVPYILYSLVKYTKNQRLEYLANLLLISVGVSGILGVIFYESFFDIIDILGVEKHY